MGPVRARRGPGSAPFSAGGGAGGGGARYPLSHRFSLAGHCRLVAANDGAGQGAAGAVLGPVLDGGARERSERLAVDAGGGGQPLGGALEGDEEVRGDAGGRVVGGAV